MTEPDYSNIHIESSLPKVWEQETTFNDILYEWMSRAPWLAISAAAHLLIFVILYAIPWDLLTPKKETNIQASLEQTPEEIFEEPPPEEPEPIEELEPTEEPILKDAEISDHNEEDTNQDFESIEGDPDFTSDSPFDANAFNDVIGIGGGAGGKFGGRFGGRRNLRTAGGRGYEQSIAEGLKWLKDHQSQEGMWENEHFMNNCGKDGRTGTCSRPGLGHYDVGLTGLALLAFLGDGHTTREGQYKEVVARGVNWLRDQQRDSSEGVFAGLYGDPIGKHFIYNHGIASLAMCEAYYFSGRNPLLKGTAQDAMNFISRARGSKYEDVWRYDVPSLGDGDTSITGWMIFAMKAAEDAGLKVDKDGYTAALAFFDELTDPATGRTGYTREGGPGSRSSRIDGINSDYPREKGEALTAVTLLCRFFMGQDPATAPIMKKQANLLKERPPLWDVPGKGNDMYYWYYGAYAMFQFGGEEYWGLWRKKMEDAVVKTQSKEGCEKGSWDPECAWGYAGGRVYSTALMVLCLETYYRYGRVLGSR